MANVLGVKTNIGIRLIIALIIILYGPGNWVQYSGKVLEKFWKIIGRNVWEPCNLPKMFFFKTYTLRTLVVVYWTFSQRTACPINGLRICKCRLT